MNIRSFMLSMIVLLGIVVFIHILFEVLERIEEPQFKILNSQVEGLK